MLEAANWAPTHGRICSELSSEDKLEVSFQSVNVFSTLAGKTEPWRFVILGSEPLQEFITVMQAV